MLMINSYLQSVLRANPSRLIQLRLSITCLITVALNQQVLFSKYEFVNFYPCFPSFFRFVTLLLNFAY